MVSLRRMGALLRALALHGFEDQVIALLAIENTACRCPCRLDNRWRLWFYDAELETGLTLTDEQHAAVVRILKLPGRSSRWGGSWQDHSDEGARHLLGAPWRRCGHGALAGRRRHSLCPKNELTHRAPCLHHCRLIGMASAGVANRQSRLRRPASDVDFPSKTLLVGGSAGSARPPPSLHKHSSLMPRAPGCYSLVMKVSYRRSALVKSSMVWLPRDPVMKLTQVLGQAADSQIPKISALVRDGQVPSLDIGGQAKGVFIVPGAQLENIQRRLRGQVELVVIAARKAHGWKPSTKLVHWARNKRHQSKT